MIKITIPAVAIVPDHPSYSQTVRDRWDIATALGAVIETVNLVATMKIKPSNASLLAVSDLTAVNSVGGTVEGFPAYLMIADGDALIPDCSLPGIDGQSQDGDPVRKTWKEWKAPYHDSWEDSSGNTWLSSVCTGRALTGAELVEAGGLSGVTVKTVAEFTAMRDSLEE